MTRGRGGAEGGVGDEETVPTILTTSQKLSTGVDARNVRNIVLMRPVNSMIEFKQIIGRGTRLFDGKDYFTIYDFVKAYHHFNDAEWDGEPESESDFISPIGPIRPMGPIDPKAKEESSEYKAKEKIKVKLADGRERTIRHMMATTFWGADGRPLSSGQFLENLFGTLPDFFKDEDELRAIWSRPDTRKTLLESLFEKGYGAEQLAEIRKLIDAEKSDLFDVLAYVAFATEPITREERVRSSKKTIFSNYEDKQQAFIDFVLSVYVKDGDGELDQDKLPKLLEIKYHAIDDAVKEFGSIAGIREMFVGFQRYLYEYERD